MNQRTNDLAIILTRKIEASVVRLCSDITTLDEKSVGAAPNFFMIRSAILQTLEDYVDVLSVEVRSSPYHEAKLSDEIVKQIRDHELVKAVGHIVEEIMRDEKHFAVFETEDEFSRFRYTRRELMVMKTALIELDSMGESK